MILSKIQPASVKVRILRTAATLIGYFDSFMFEFIVSNFWGAVQMVGLLHGISVLVEKTGKMVGLLVTELGISVDK